MGCEDAMGWDMMARARASRDGQVWAGMGRYGQVWAGIGRYGQVWAGMGRSHVLFPMSVHVRLVPEAMVGTLPAAPWFAQPITKVSSVAVEPEKPPSAFPEFAPQLIDPWLRGGTMCAHVPS